MAAETHQEIHFVTGKGGVGKSLVAASLALSMAKKGRKTLLVEFGERSFYRDFFELPQVGYEPTPLMENLDVALWNGRNALREYAQSLIRIEALTRLFFENSVSRTLVDIAPGLTELSLLGKLTAGPRGHGPADNHEVIVIDAFSTGHFLALLRAPAGLAGAIRFGPMGEQSRSIDAALRNPGFCHTHIVCLPEEMPVKETEELTESLQNEFGLRPAIILNKVLPLAQIPEDALAGAHPFVGFVREARERQADMETRLEKLGCALRRVPLLLAESSTQLVEAAAGALS